MLREREGRGELRILPQAQMRLVTVTRRATMLWIVDYTVREGREERCLSTAMAAEAAARRMVANLLAQRRPDASVDDVFTESLG